MKTPKKGDIVRLMAPSSSARLSNVYKSVDLPKDTLCRVVGRVDHCDHYWEARPLRFIKSRLAWEERPLSVGLIDFANPHPNGWGAHWEFSKLP